MDGKQNFWGGVAVAVGLIVMGAMIPAAVSRYCDSARTVSVKGLCEREVAADKVIWPIKFKVAGNDLAEVYASLEKGGATVREFLISGGLGAADISRSVPNVSDKMTQEYGGNDRACRYVATVTYTVCSKDVDTVLKLMDRQNELIKAGVAPEYDWETQTRFLFEGLNEIKPEMIQEATRNAREVALKFASDSHSRLGKIKTATQGTFSIEDRDSCTPQTKKVRIVTYVDYYLKK